MATSFKDLQQMVNSFPAVPSNKAHQDKAQSLGSEIHLFYLESYCKKTSDAQKEAVIEDYKNFQAILTQLMHGMIDHEKANNELNLMLGAKRKEIISDYLVNSTKILLGLGASVATGGFLYLMVGVGAAPPIAFVIAASLVLLHCLISTLQILSQFKSTDELTNQRSCYQNALNFFAAIEPLKLNASVAHDDVLIEPTPSLIQSK